MNKISGIYKITNILNLNFYVGRSINVERRLKQHLWDLKANRHHNPKLQNSFNKYGEANFLFSIMCEAPAEDLIEIEQLAIDEGIKTGRCFNINTNAEHGGVVGRVWTEEQIENIKRGQIASEKFQQTSFKNQSKEARDNALRLAHTPEARAKSQATRKENGFDVNENFKESRAIREKAAIQRTLLAIDWVIETRETMSVANKRFKINQRMWCKTIPLWEEATGRVFDLPSRASGDKNGRSKGAFIVVSPDGVFKNTKIASDFLGIPKSTIHYRCTNKLLGWYFIKPLP